MLYQIKYAPMIQKYTSGWPKYQNSMRVIITLIVGVQPSDQGMRKNNISIATPIVAMNHMTKVHSEPWTTSGNRSPRRLRQNQVAFTTMSSKTIHVPMTSNVVPM